MNGEVVQRVTAAAGFQLTQLRVPVAQELVDRGAQPAAS